MTKKKTSPQTKLALKKRPVRKLDDSQLEEVGGGWDSGAVAPPTGGCPSQNCPIAFTDNCATQTCRINYTRANHNQGLRRR